MRCKHTCIYANVYTDMCVCVFECWMCAGKPQSREVVIGFVAAPVRIDTQRWLPPHGGAYLRVCVCVCERLFERILILANVCRYLFAPARSNECGCSQPQAFNHRQLPYFDEASNKSANANLNKHQNTNAKCIRNRHREKCRLCKTAVHTSTTRQQQHQQGRLKTGSSDRVATLITNVQQMKVKIIHKKIQPTANWSKARKNRRKTQMHLSVCVRSYTGAATTHVEKFRAIELVITYVKSIYLCI